MRVATRCLIVRRLLEIGSLYLCGLVRRGRGERGRRREEPLIWANAFGFDPFS